MSTNYRKILEMPRISNMHAHVQIYVYKCVCVHKDRVFSYIEKYPIPCARVHVSAHVCGQPRGWPWIVGGREGYDVLLQREKIGKTIFRENDVEREEKEFCKCDWCQEVEEREENCHMLAAWKNPKEEREIIERRQREEREGVIFGVFRERKN